VAKVVQADLLAAVTIQTRSVAGRVECSERIPT
jgi:hypothetical protein